MLAILLPTEDLENACLRTLVADIVGEMILGNGIGGKACEGWLIWEGITKGVLYCSARLPPKATGEEIEIDTRSRLEKFGLLSEKTEATRSPSGSGRQSALSGLFWRVLQYAFLAFLAGRFIISGLMTASSSHRAPPARDSTSSPITPTSEPPQHRRPILRFQIFSLISCLIELRSRMPWLVGCLSLVQHGMISGLGMVAETDGLLDR